MTAGLTVSVLLAVGAFVLALPSGRSGARPRPAAEQREGRGIRDAPLMLDLLAVLLSSGASVESALSVIAGACEPEVGSPLGRVHAARLLGASWEAAWDVGEGGADTPAAGRPVLRRRERGGPYPRRCVAEVREGLRFATSTGAPSAALLHAHAAQLRRRHNREIDRKAAALGVQLVLPLGLCSLPAFICLGVVPVVLGLLPAL